MSSNDERAIALLEELVVWTRFATRAAILAAWETILADDRHLLAYELSDGSRNQQQVADATGLSQPTISTLWARWRRLGIARVQGKVVAHLARPSDLGMDRAMRLVVPSTKGRRSEANATSESSVEDPAGG